MSTFNNMIDYAFSSAHADDAVADVNHVYISVSGMCRCLLNWIHNQLGWSAIFSIH